MTASAPPHTPLMQQYHDLKAQFPEELLMFRLGDFFELFADDAQKAAPILEVALTHRQHVPMCGVPAHALDPYIAKLLKAGLRVAVADQLEEAAAAKGLVKRGVVRVITPGTLHEDSLLSARRSNFLAALVWDEEGIGLAFLESSTGEFMCTEWVGAQAAQNASDELARLAPSEVLIAKQNPESEWVGRLKRQGLAVTEMSPLDFSLPLAEQRLKSLYETTSLRGFGLEGKKRAACAAGAAARYLERTQCGKPLRLKALRTYSSEAILQMDANTLDHLDLLPNAASTGKTLLDVLDHTSTPMGGRLIRRWVSAPLRRAEDIHQRQDRVAHFLDNKERRSSLKAQLCGWPDIERILTRLTAGTTLPRDLAHISAGLKRLPRIAALLPDFPQENALAGLLKKAVVEAPPISVKDGGVISDGYNAELDEVRLWLREGKTKLLELEKREREQTGIASLKIGFNNVFGYYLDITKTHLSKVPSTYIRKQTTASGERYITPELKEFENRILGAEERLVRLEMSILSDLREAVIARTESLRHLAATVAELDVFLSLADVAERHHYVRPRVDDSGILLIREGRHPVLEETLPSGTLVPNDTDLETQEKRIVVLTGPNMSGKSTYLRQTALIVVMAQMGSFVPAQDAHIGVIDQLFTRIGASDRLMEGESTFMVEMVETARILNHATPKSLVILDEVGRGTSTYDGISIAWACVEYLHARGPKVLFATHYFELTRLPQEWPGVINAHVAAREWGDHVIFLHKVEPGPADRSYGIHVARLAGVPKSVLGRAAALLEQLEKGTMMPVDKKKTQQPELF